jgi:hypothetical protein
MISRLDIQSVQSMEINKSPHTVTLREVQVSHRELSTFNMNWEIDFAPPGEVLDIAISAMFGSSYAMLSRISVDSIFTVQSYQELS